jgi:hypothetical protein
LMEVVTCLRSGRVPRWLRLCRQGQPSTSPVADGEIDGGWRRDFRRRWTAFAASELGSALGYSALPIVAVLVLSASDFQVTLLNVLAGVASAVLALPMDPWIEHHRKPAVMVAADLLRFVVIVSVPVAAYVGMLTYWQLCLVAIVQMEARLAFDSAGAAMRLTQPHRHLRVAPHRAESAN